MISPEFSGGNDHIHAPIADDNLSRVRAPRIFPARGSIFLFWRSLGIRRDTSFQTKGFWILTLRTAVHNPRLRGAQVPEGHNPRGGISNKPEDRTDIFQRQRRLRSTCEEGRQRDHRLNPSCTEPCRIEPAKIRPHSVLPAPDGHVTPPAAEGI